MKMNTMLANDMACDQNDLNLQKRLAGTIQETQSLSVFKSFLPITTQSYNELFCMSLKKLPVR